MTVRFFGKRALVVGGTCELAVTLADLMMQENLFPILTYRDDDGRNRIEDVLKDPKGRYAAYVLNLGDRSALDDLFRTLGQDLDYMVDFAQGDLEGSVASSDEDLFYPYFRENVAFRAELMKRAARVMLLKGRGRLVFVSSLAAVRANPGQGFYAAAKSASEALYRNLGLELGARGVTTVNLRPGYIDSGRGRDFLQRMEHQPLQNVPIRRALTKEEVADTIMFLLSDSALGINATELIMDGGLTSGK